MKKLVIITLLFTINLINAQELSYGVIFENSFYESGNNNSKNATYVRKNYAFNPGIYGEYNFNEKIGIKTEIYLKNKNINYKPYNGGYVLNFEVDLKYLEINPNFKYDFGDEYRKGFYMLAGPKLCFLTKAKSDSEDVKEEFESFYIGAQLGFGYRVFKYIDLQTKLEYDISPFFKLENGNKSNFFGAVFSANIDLAKLLSKA